jgi:hypothetical protein
MVLFIQINEENISFVIGTGIACTYSTSIITQTSEEIMKKLNAALLIIAGLCAFMNLMEAQRVSADTSFFRNGTVSQILLRHDGVLVERQDFYRTGEPLLKQEFDPVHGLQTNVEFWWFRNGRLQHTCEWVNGYAHGRALTWNEHGDLVKSQVFVESTEVPVEDYAKYFPEKGSRPEAVAQR